jgi:hypothetical protein
MGSGIGVVATCRRGRQWSTERCFVPCSGGPLRLSLDNLGTVTLTAVGSHRRKRRCGSMLHSARCGVFG